MPDYPLFVFMPFSFDLRDSRLVMPVIADKTGLNYRVAIGVEL
jgi:hypothetical protein